MPQHGGWPGRLGNLPAQGRRCSDQARGLSRRLSCFRYPQLCEINSRTSPRIQPGGNRSIERRAARVSRRNDRWQGADQVTIKAVVFDAYGTLYDIQSVADVTEQAFPGYGKIITQIWRIKQLEYSWLRSLIRRSNASWTDICISIFMRTR